MIGNIAKGIKLRIESKLGIVNLGVKELSQQRLSICNECPSMKFNKLMDTEVCGECGCLLQLKTLVEEEKCKLDKW